MACQEVIARQCVGINDSCFCCSLPFQFCLKYLSSNNPLLAVLHKPPPAMGDLLTEMPNQGSNGQCRDVPEV